jgi:hypothetical protein
MDGNPTAGCEIREDVIVPVGEPWSSVIKAGEILRLIDLEGQQAIDFLCYNQHDSADRYNAANTIKLNGNIYLGKDAGLWSVKANRLMTVVEDTCGLHDTIYGCCSVEVDDVRFGENNGKGCQSNFELELSKHGLNEKDVAANINFFMHVPVESSGALGTYIKKLILAATSFSLRPCFESSNSKLLWQPLPLFSPNRTSSTSTEQHP